MITLSGCGKESGEVNERELIKYDLSLSMVKTEYRIYDSTEKIIMYFPVATNKEITATDLGGVAAKLPLMKENIKVTLRAMQQDKLNFLYQDKYISCLKYRVDIENKKLLQANDIINLCDTTLWIYHNSEFQKIQFDEGYLRITIVDKESETVMPEWKNIISNIRKDIELELNNRANETGSIFVL